MTKKIWGVGPRDIGGLPPTGVAGVSRPEPVGTVEVNGVQYVGVIPKHAAVDIHRSQE